MNNRGRSRRQGQQQASNKLQRELTSLKHAVNGVKTRPPADPRSFIAIPWNSFTYEKSIVTTSDDQVYITTVDNVLSQLLIRVGLSSATTLGMKVKSAQCWATCAGSSFALPTVVAEFHELANPQAANTVRSTQRDRGTLNRPASAGYVYPIADSREILDSRGSGSVKILTVTGGDTGTYLTARIQFLWRASVV